MKRPTVSIDWLDNYAGNTYADTLLKYIEHLEADVPSPELQEAKQAVLDNAAVILRNRANDYDEWLQPLWHAVRHYEDVKPTPRRILLSLLTAVNDGDMSPDEAVAAAEKAGLL